MVLDSDIPGLGPTQAASASLKVLDMPVRIGGPGVHWHCSLALAARAGKIWVLNHQAFASVPSLLTMNVPEARLACFWFPLVLDLTQQTPSFGSLVLAPRPEE
jgi:hypothetical protein